PSMGRSSTSSTSGSGRPSMSPTARSRSGRSCSYSRASEHRRPMNRLLVPEDAAGERLDVFVARAAGMTRARAGALIDAGGVRVNDDVARKSLRVSPDDAVELSEIAREEVVPPSGVEIVYEDDDLLVVDKP